MMDVTRNVGNNDIDGAIHLDLKHWKRIISSVFTIDNMKICSQKGFIVSDYH